MSDWEKRWDDRYFAESVEYQKDFIRQLLKEEREKVKKIMNPPESISDILWKYDNDTCYVMGFNHAIKHVEEET